MAVYTFTTNVSTFGIASLLSGDSVIVAGSGQVVAPTESLLSAAGAANVTVAVAGQIHLDRIQIDGTSSLTIGATGAVYAHNVNEAVRLVGSASTFTNSGTLDALRGGGVFVAGTNIRLENAGSIHAAKFGVNLGNNTMTNSGDIFGMQGVVATGFASKITNDGSIRAFDNAISFGDVAATASTHLLVNNGQITSAQSRAIESVFINANTLVHIFNNGTLSGGGTAITLGGASFDRIINTGTISGGVSLNGGTDLLDSRGGLIAGNVDLGDGSDTFNIIGGRLIGTVSGGLGLDTYRIDNSDTQIIETGSDVDKVFADCSYQLASLVENLTLIGSGNWYGYAGAGNNNITGNSGDNRLGSGDGNDSLFGGFGQDSLAGGNGNDSLRGEDGDDLLNGGNNNDSLFGDAGDDLLIGGEGRDSLSGGGGSDEFRFAKEMHLNTSLATADIISDFIRGEDVINLSGIDAKTNNTASNDAFTFIGSAAFSNVAGQLRFAGGVIEMDINGNGTADYFIQLTGIASLSASDLIL